MGAEAARLCAARAVRATGTHALVLTASPRVAPSWPPGVACATTLSRTREADEWSGPLRAGLADLPFADAAFCVVCACFPGTARVPPEILAPELARILAVDGVLLVADVHPLALWRAPSSSPRRWQRALRGAGLEVASAARFGAPWPRARGTDGLPHWLVRALGGGWLLAARRRPQAGATVIRPAFASRRVREPAAALLPGAGAHRQCA